MRKPYAIAFTTLLALAAISLTIGAAQVATPQSDLTQFLGKHVVIAVENEKLGNPESFGKVVFVGREWITIQVFNAGTNASADWTYPIRNIYHIRSDATPK